MDTNNSISPGKYTYNRILKIDKLLRAGKLSSIAELAEEFKVSQRTIERDIEALRDYFGAPLAYAEPGRTCFHINF